MKSQFLAALVVFLGISIVGLYFVKKSDKKIPVIPQKKVIPKPLEKEKEEVVPEKPKEFTFEDALNSIKEDELKNNLEYLASDKLEGRMSGKEGHFKAAEHIEKNVRNLD